MQTPKLTPATRRFLKYAEAFSPFNRWPVDFARSTFERCKTNGWIERCGIRAAMTEYRITEAGRALLESSR